MSKFYPIRGEKEQKEAQAMRLRQAMMTTNGRHTGSKSLNKLNYCIHRATSAIVGLYHA